MSWQDPSADLANVNAAYRLEYELRERYRQTLVEIRKRAGAVCAQYEICDHPACQASYAAWALADEVLQYDPLAKEPA